MQGPPPLAGKGLRQVVKPWGGGEGVEIHTLQYSCLENPHGQSSLVGYSPWGRRVGYG